MKRLAYILIILICSVAFVSVSHADTVGGSASGRAEGTVGGSASGNGAPGLCAEAGSKLCNPLKVKSLEELVMAILKIIIQVGTVVSVFMIIYAGFLFVKAQGNPTEIAKAKSAFYTAIVGMVVLIGAQAIAKVITTTVSQLQ